MSRETREKITGVGRGSWTTSSRGGALKVLHCSTVMHVMHGRLTDTSLDDYSIPGMEERFHITRCILLFKSYEHV